MNFLKLLFGGGGSDVVKSFGDVLDELVTTDEERDAAALLKQKAGQQPQLAALAINSAAAKSKNWFTSGGRPALLWVAAVGLFMFYVPQYAVAAVVWTRINWNATGELSEYPVTADGLLELVALAIGLGTIRHFGKKDGHDQ